MTTDELLAELKRRNLTVHLLSNGTPCLRGPKEAATPPLLKVLKKWHRQEIVRRLTPQKQRIREWLWRYGHTYTEQPGDLAFGHEAHHPVGAWWWRYVGETQWRPVPGRPVTGQPGSGIPEPVPMPESTKRHRERAED